MLESEFLILAVAILITLTAIILLIILDWRISLITLALQYLLIFVMILPLWPLSMAAAKLIASWISAAVLGMAILGNPELNDQLSLTHTHAAASEQKEEQNQIREVPGVVFRLFSAGLVALTIASQLERFSLWLPTIPPAYAWSGLLLIGFGLIKIGFTYQPFHVLVALLSALAGFEILYAILEKSVISAGLFAAINLAISLIGAYLLTAPYMEAET